jgi:hypothetical protein
VSEPGPWEAAKIVSVAGGQIIGSTRLQKVGCLLDLAGAGTGFAFAYHLFGPYSEDLSIAATDAKALNLVSIEERIASWGGRYCIYRAPVMGVEDVPASVRKLAEEAAAADTVELELAVTAGFLAKNGYERPWEEVASRKEGKATPERLARARALYASFQRLNLPRALPAI